MSKCCMNDSNCIENSKIILGLCGTHYMRFKRWKDPFFIITRLKCEICNNKHYAVGLCRRHYDQTYEIRNKHKEYHRNNPEVKLKSYIKRLTKLGKLFDITFNEYKYALQDWSKTIKNRQFYV